ncbi:MAG: heme exporter protein CcmB [Cytophagaceae bacterium]|nr:heme exporter protein CcmB [Gemmatimonadaceae bacterium]
MSLRDDWRRARAVALKDLTAERRSRAGLNAVTFLGVLVLMLFGFALGPDTEAMREAAVGAIWLAILFSGVLAFNRCYQLELDGGALEPLLLYPGSRWSIFVGKVLANLAFVFLVELIVIPVAMVLFHVVVPGGALAQIAVLVLGTIGFVTLGTFYAAMSSRSRSREVLLPLLLFPMMIPALLASVQASTALLSGDLMREAGAWVRLLIAYDVIFVAASLAAFEFAIEV